MNLATCARRVSVRIVAVEVGDQVGLRLRELGLRPGALVEVTHDGRSHGRVVAVGADRFALDRRTCSGIRVEAAG